MVVYSVSLDAALVLLVDSRVANYPQELVPSHRGDSKPSGYLQGYTDMMRAAVKGATMGPIMNVHRAILASQSGAYVDGIVSGASLDIRDTIANPVVGEAIMAIPEVQSEDGGTSA